MIKTAKLYYKSDQVLVRDAVISDVFELARNMRLADQVEIWKSHHRTPESALLTGYSESVVCLTVERKESPIAMFGIIPRTIMGSTASVWLLGAPEMEKVQRAFLEQSRRFIDFMLSYYPTLENYVSIENTQSIRWLKWCGAEFAPAAPYGIEQQLFQYFKFRR